MTVAERIAAARSAEREGSWDAALRGSFSETF
jgi:hypothetical protein